MRANAQMVLSRARQHDFSKLTSMADVAVSASAEAVTDEDSG
jgi:hypothetical protein